MARLQDIVPDARLTGVVRDASVVVVAVVPFGDGAAEISYRLPDGSSESRIFFADEIEGLAVEKGGWGFSANGDDFKLASEALRISLASTQDPFLAVRTSRIRPLPHQISAVYEKMLPRLPLRYVLADDPGAGKTVMAGLLIKEMMARGDLKRCLVVCPGSLCVQWQDELLDKFGLDFAILTRDAFEASARRNAFLDHDLAIASLDRLARDKEIDALIASCQWDLVIFDEAHKLAAHVYGREVKYTARYRLAQLLSDHTENLLLMTATPHNGKPKDFQQFMALVDADRFVGAAHGEPSVDDVSDVMRRLVKEELLTFEGRPLFPERIAHTVSYELTPLEDELYQEVTEYVRTGFNRADSIGDGTKRNSVGFALTVLQRRLASSPAAILNSLRRRRDRLKEELADMKAGRTRKGVPGVPEDYWGSPADDEDLTQEELDSLEDSTSGVTAAETEAELVAEIAELDRLVGLAERVYRSKDDRKWQELSKLLQDTPAMYARDGSREKLVIFTEHKDTLDYLAVNIRQLLGRPEAVEIICGGMGRDARRQAENRFKNDKGVEVLLATDAAGEGINLQQAHLEISYDLPWNPNKLEQRFGRIHRIGQTEVCHLWNLVAGGTREGQVYERLLNKLEVERGVLGGRVFDVLGEVSFGDKSLADLLKDAVRYGSDPARVEELNRVVEGALDQEKLRQLLSENALTDDVMDQAVVTRVREEMELAEARKLQPHYVALFFRDAIKLLGGGIAEREPGRFEITRTPDVMLQRDRRGKGARALLRRYTRVCFDGRLAEVPGAPDAEFVYPGHPLMDAVIDTVLSLHGNLLTKGAVLIDEGSCDTEPRSLFYVEDRICDGRRTSSGDQHTVARNLCFVGMAEDGRTFDSGDAPYLDYSAPTKDERELLDAWLEERRPFAAVSEQAVRVCAMRDVVPRHMDAVKALRVPRLEKMRAAVDRRLAQEIRYWSVQSSNLRTKGGDSAQARRRVHDLTQRRAARLAEIDEELRIFAVSPQVVGCALVVPRVLMETLKAPGMAVRLSADAQARRSVELCAMEAVMATERALGFEPADVSADHCGFDVLSRPPEGQVPAPGQPVQRFIEVKGRIKGSTDVTLTRNEILTALNSPDNFILAICEAVPQEDGTLKAGRLVYIKHPFKKEVEDSTLKVTHSIQSLIDAGKVCLREEDLHG